MVYIYTHTVTGGSYILGVRITYNRRVRIIILFRGAVCNKIRRGRLRLDGVLCSHYAPWRRKRLTRLSHPTPARVLLLREHFQMITFDCSRVKYILTIRKQYWK